MRISDWSSDVCSSDFFATRPPKQKVDLDTLHAQWAERSKAHIPALEAVRAAADARGEKHLDADPATARRAALFGLRQSETREADNNLGRLIRTGLASHVGDVRLRDVRPLFEEHEARLKLLKTSSEARRVGQECVGTG